MDVFVIGATGELGRPAVREMVAAGHRVRAAARTQAKAALLASLGAEAVVVPDVFDRDAVSRAARGSEALLHLATHIPPVRAMRKPAAWAENNRLRSELTPMLVDIALDLGIERLVAESVTFVYPDRGSEWISETTPVANDNTALESVLDLERELERFRSAGGHGVTLRFSWFYGPSAESTDAALRFARLRLAPTFGSRDGYQSSIHTDDAGSAVAAALRAPSRTFNVADDEPLLRCDYANAFADALGRKRLWIAPPTMLRIAARNLASIVRSQRVRNEHFKDETGWTPRYPSAREGWRAVVSARVKATVDA